MNRTAFRLAVLLAALVAGSRAARAGEADGFEPTAAPAAPEAPEAIAPQVSDQFDEPRALDAPEKPYKPEKPRMSWYGWQTLLADGGTVGLWALGFVVDDAKYGSGEFHQNYEIGANVLFAAGFATYAFGAPAIHWAHGHGGRGWGSFGLRVGLPIAGAIAGVLIGSLACDKSNNYDDEFIECPVITGALGFLSGVAAAPVVDAAVLAREPVTPPTGPRLQAAAFVPSSGGGTLVLGGRF